MYFSRRLLCKYRKCVQANGAVVIHVAIYRDQPDPFSGLKIDRVFPSRGSPNGKIPTTTQMHGSILFHLTTYIRGFCHHIHTSTMTLISQCMIDKKVIAVPCMVVRPCSGAQEDRVSHKDFLYLLLQKDTITVIIQQSEHP